MFLAAGARVMDDFKLIELVRQNQQLYDKNHAEYRDIVKKSVIWKAIGVALGASAEFCRKRFRCLRDRFNKERKVRKNDMLNDPTLPPVYKKMLFLWDHLTHRRVRNLTSIPGDIAVSSQAIKEEIEKQILKLTEIEASDEEGSTKNTGTSEMVQNDLVLIFNKNNSPPCELASPNDIAQGGPDPSEKKVLPTPKLKDEILCQYLVQEHTSDEGNGFKMPPQIMIVRNTKGNNTTKDLEDIPESNTDQSNESNQSGKDEEISNCEKQSDEIDQPSIRQGTIMEASSIYEQTCEADHSYEKKSKSSEINNSSDLLNMRKKMKKGDPLLPNKRLKMANEFTASVQQTDQQTCKIRTIKPSCNDAFCAIVKQYLDKIKSPERLSAARLQILTILHNELYSTYS